MPQWVSVPSLVNSRMFWIKRNGHSLVFIGLMLLGKGLLYGRNWQV